LSAASPADKAGLPPEQQDWAALQAFALSAGQDSGIRDLVVADASGVVRASSDAARVGTRYRPPTGEAAMASGALRASAAPDAGRGAGIRFVQPIAYAGANFGNVDLVMRRAPLDAALAATRTAMAVLFCVVMLVVLCIGYLSGAMVARPLARLRRALDAAAASGFQLRISHRRRDEFGAAFDAFNLAAAAMEARVDPSATSPTELDATRVVRPIARAA